MPKLSSINLSAKVPLYKAMEESTRGVRLARNRTAAQIKAVCDWLEEGMPMETRSRLRAMLMREVEIAYDSLDPSDAAQETPDAPGFVAGGHPVTLPDEVCARLLGSGKTFYEMLTEAARWGADTELEACCHEVQNMYSGGSRLRTARRPKPPTLKQQALEEMRALVSYMEGKGEIAVNFDTIRQVIDSLPDTED